MKVKSRPWSAYVLRILCSVLMFLSAYALLGSSTFALRMRGDFPVLTIVLGLSAFLAFFPLLFGKRYLGALIASAFLVSGIGAYWWTTIPWDEFIKDSGFPTSSPARFVDYALVASPAVVCAFYAVVSRPSVLRADLKNRGADADEIRSAAAMSFLAGAALLVLCGALAAALWALMASGVAFRAIAPLPTGLPAIVLVAALCTVAYAIVARRLPRFRPRGKPAAGSKAPVPGASSAVKRSSLAARVFAIFSFRRPS